MPVTWGITRPVILLPAGSTAWPDGRLSTVLLHELLHVRRFDLLAQAIAQAACSVFWFHPLAWLGLREQRREREQACDDAVLRLGVPAHDYAGHIMDLVRSFPGSAVGAMPSPWRTCPISKCGSVPCSIAGAIAGL